ncbi:hypothetical protein QMK33_15165 [Hymenobacter sp. H14-R3]|uniref:hypothetical protein n=1 Tax=Hymenobacter sp. H14-R3 TaxID=3046308 RepID=UPI0024BA4AE2|nr:hypothetical protein [Hymenobacter sp. H14-R3]MDJ0366498.1 hypothetical protein [Hymenobacter sp. H14-R3]
MKNKLLLLTLFLVFTGCSSQNDPTPAAGVVTLNFLNNTSWLGVPTSASLHDTPLRAAGAHKVLWTGNARNSSVVVGPVARGTRLYLSVQCDDVSAVSYWWPAKGEVMQVDLMVDGKRVTGVSLNADSPFNPATFYLTKPPQTCMVQEVEVTI